MNKQYIQLILINIREFYREPGILFWGFLFPVITAWGLGIAFTGKPVQIKKVAVIDSTAVQDTLTKQYRNFTFNPDGHRTYSIADNKLGTTTFVFDSTYWNEAIIKLKQGKVAMILVLTNSGVNYHFDPRSPESQLIYNQLNQLFTNPESLIASDAVQPMKLEGTRYIDFLVPGLIAMGCMMSSMWGIGYTLIERRSKKLLRRMVATPMKKIYYMIGLFIARYVLNFLEAGVLMLFAWLFFDIKIQGSPAAFVIIYTSGFILFSGLAVLVASRTSKLEIGNGLINAVVTPMMFVSGIFFSYSNFPDGVANVISYLPLTMVADATRAIYNEGATVATILPETLMLTGFGILFLLIGIRIFKWY